jgi:hypothetical protein
MPPPAIPPGFQQPEVVMTKLKSLQVLCASVLAALVGIAEVQAQTKAETTTVLDHRQIGRFNGSFGGYRIAEITNEKRSYEAAIDRSPEVVPIFGYITSRTSSSATREESDGGDGNRTSAQDVTATSSSRSAETDTFRLPAGVMKISGQGVSANVEPGGRVSTETYVQISSFLDDIKDVSAATASWTDTWLVAPTSTHAAGTIGRLSATLSLEGAFTLDVGDPAPENGATATFGTSDRPDGLTLRALDTEGDQSQAATGYLDFVYGKSFNVSLGLRSEAMNVGTIKATSSFSARLASIALPEGATLKHSLGNLNIIPEPSSWTLMLLGLAMAAQGVRSRRRSAQVTP